jgi:hypothetical protein
MTNKTKNLTKKEIAAEVVSHYLIRPGDMATIYISPDAYPSAFDEELNLQSSILPLIGPPVYTFLIRIIASY